MNGATDFFQSHLPVLERYMFGKRVDYWLLRPFVHSRGKKSEAELNAAFNTDTPFDAEAASARLDKLIHRFNGTFGIDPKARYLDVGCGRGDLDIALVKAGAQNVTGIDFVPRNIDAARIAAKNALSAARQPTFVCGDIHTFEPEAPFDVVLSHEALEHIRDPACFIRRLGGLITEDGAVFLAFGPLFHSALGDHMGDFFRIPIPWRAVLFNEKAILKLRSEFFRPGNAVDRFEDISIGMNKMRFSDFLRAVTSANLSLDFMAVNPQLDRFGPLGQLAKNLSKIPRVQDYATLSVYAVLTRPKSE